jgi:hypothetical protein
VQNLAKRTFDQTLADIQHGFDCLTCLLQQNPTWCPTALISARDSSLRTFAASTRAQFAAELALAASPSSITSASASPIPIAAS